MTPDASVEGLKFSVPVGRKHAQPNAQTIQVMLRILNICRPLLASNSKKWSEDVRRQKSLALAAAAASTSPGLSMWLQVNQWATIPWQSSNCFKALRGSRCNDADPSMCFSILSFNMIQLCPNCLPHLNGNQIIILLPLPVFAV